MYWQIYFLKTSFSPNTQFGLEVLPFSLEPLLSHMDSSTLFNSAKHLKY